MHPPSPRFCVRRASCVRACVRACVPACVHVCVCVHACVRARVRACVRACVHACALAYMCVCVHVRLCLSVYARKYMCESQGPNAECWAEAPIKIARMTLTVKLDGNWSSFQLANSAPPLSVTDSAIAPSARIGTQHVTRRFRPQTIITRAALAKDGFGQTVSANRP